MTDITRRDFLNGVALTIAAGLTPAAQIAAQPAALSARAHRDARPACRLVRDRPRACATADLRARRSAGRGDATIWWWSAAASAGLRRPGSTGAPGPRAHPHPRQPRRFRRPCQAQRVQPRWAPDHRLWRQRVDAIAQGAVQQRRQGPAAGARRRYRAFRDGVRAQALSFARAVARRVLSARDFGRDVLVTGDPTGTVGTTTSRRLSQRQAARRIHRRVPGRRPRARRN